MSPGRSAIELLVGSEYAPDGARGGRKVWFEPGPSREEPNRR